MAKAQLPAKIGDRVEIIDVRHDYHNCTGKVVQVIGGGFLRVEIAESSDYQTVIVTADQIILLVD